MKKRVIIPLLVAASLTFLAHCTSHTTTDGASTQEPALNSDDLPCSHDDTLSADSADAMIEAWESVTAGLHINDKVALGKQQIDSMVKSNLLAPTVRTYVGLIPMEDADSLNLGLIVALVDSGCSIAEEDQFLLFEGMTGIGRSIGIEEMRGYVTGFVHHIYALPQFAGWPPLQGFGFSREYFRKLVTSNPALTKGIGEFSVRSYVCSEVSTDCNEPMHHMQGLDVIIRDWLEDPTHGNGVHHVAVNFSVPCPRFCGSVSVVSE